MAKSRKRSSELSNSGTASDDEASTGSDDAVARERNSVAKLAFVVAVCSLLVTFWGGCESRKYRRLSVRPMLRIARFTATNQPVKITVENAGLGPAIITKYRVFVDGAEVDAPPSDTPAATAVKRVIKEPGDVYSYTFRIPDAMAPKDEHDLIRLADVPDDKASREELREHLLRVRFRIDYESIYGEQFFVENYPQPQD